MFALYHVLLQFCTRHPDTLRRSQLLVKVDKESVVGAFRKGRVKDPVTHTLLVQLFMLQVEFGFMLSLKRLPNTDNGIADAISRPAREGVIRLTPRAFQELWGALGPFNFDLMACSESAQNVPDSNNRLPFFSQYDCEGSSGTDVLAQDVVKLPGTGREDVRTLLSPSSTGRNHSPAFGGMPGSRRYCRAGYPGVLVSSGTTGLR